MERCNIYLVYVMLSYVAGSKWNATICYALLRSLRSLYAQTRHRPHLTYAYILYNETWNTQRAPHTYDDTLTVRTRLPSVVHGKQSPSPKKNTHVSMYYLFRRRHFSNCTCQEKNCEWWRYVPEVRYNVTPNTERAPYKISIRAHVYIRTSLPSGQLTAKRFLRHKKKESASLECLLVYATQQAVSVDTFF